MVAEVTRVEGLEQLDARLKGLTSKLRASVLRNALAAGAREVRDTAKRSAPVLRAGTALKAPYRKPGTVRDAIRVRTSKAAKQAGDVGVFVNVKPLAGAKYRRVTKRSLFTGKKVRTRQLVKASDRGAKNPNDPFYWRFLEFGTKRMAPRSFLRPAADKLPQALTIFERQLAKYFNKVNASGNPAVNP